MKCPSADLLQAYIDGELEIGMKKDLENHIPACEKCSRLYKELKENDDFVFNTVIKYKQYMDDNANAPAGSFKHTGTTDKTPSRERKEYRMTSLAFKFRKVAAAVLAVLVVTTCIAVQPIRAAVSDVLSIFRIENVKGINITLKDIEQIQDQLRSNTPEIDLKSMGKISVTGGQQKQITPEDLSGIQDFKVMLPSGLKASTPSISLVEPQSINFNFNVSKVNSIMKSFGATKLLPESVDGKTFQLDTPAAVNISYIVDGKSCDILQTRLPEIIVPEGVDVDAVYDSLTDLPILPDNLQKQLKSIKDWKTTLYVPVIENKTQEVDINGNNGYLYTRSGTGTPQSALMWSDNGVIRGIAGDFTGDELIALARSMR